MTIERTLQQIQKDKFWKEKKIIIPVLGALSVNIITWLYVWLKFSGSTEEVVLHYNILFGVDTAGRWQELFIYPLSGLAIFIIDLGLIFYCHLFRRVRLKNLLLVAVPVIEVVLFLAVLLIAKAN
jgi:hypothetical protein